MEPRPAVGLCFGGSPLPKAWALLGRRETEWETVARSEYLDRLTHHVHILEMNGDSYRLEHSKKARRRSADSFS